MYAHDAHRDARKFGEASAQSRRDAQIEENSKPRRTVRLRPPRVVSSHAANGATGMYTIGPRLRLQNISFEDDEVPSESTGKTAQAWVGSALRGVHAIPCTKQAQK